jgi:hypothetical protein
MNFQLLFLLFLLLSPHMFVEYKIHSYIESSNQVICNIILETVNTTYPNGTFTYTIQVFFMNFSKYTPPSLVSDNLTNPQTFFYIPPNEVGEKVIQRQIPLTLVNESNGTYVYIGKQYVEYVEIETYYFVNKTGVPYKMETLQIGENGGLVSVTTYTLIRSNIFKNETPIIPQNFSLDNSSIRVSISNNVSDFLGTYVILFNIIAIPLLLLYKVKRK